MVDDENLIFSFNIHSVKFILVHRIGIKRKETFYQEYLQELRIKLGNFRITTLFDT
jgi:hypothetical protein